MMTVRYGVFMEQAVSRRKKVKIIIAPTYDDSRAKIALWSDPLKWGHVIVVSMFLNYGFSCWGVVKPSFIH